jgi:DNA-binding HxlR family transcriptional regulator
MELIGERWSLLIVRELMLGGRRFSDLRASLPGISAKVLTERLAGLERAGVVVRRRLPPPAATQVYELTEWGYEAEPIVQSLGRWATRSPGHDPTLPLSGTSLMLSFRTMFDAERAKGMAARLGFRIGAESFVVTLADGHIEAVRGETTGADLVIEGSAPAIAGFIYGSVPLVALEAEGALSVTGDRALADRFAALFPLPPKAGTAA